VAQTIMYLQNRGNLHIASADFIIRPKYGSVPSLVGTDLYSTSTRDQVTQIHR
jgi:hypothetical protein